MAEMKMRTFKFIPVLIMTIATVLSAGADVLFREDFTAYSNTSLQDFGGWHAYYTASAVSTDETTTDYNVGPIISGSTGATGTSGFFFYDNDNFGGKPVLILTDKVTSFGDIDSVTNISFSLKNNSSSENLKVAIKIDDNWYVSQDVFNSSSSSVWAEQNLAVQAASWNSLILVAESSLIEGGAVSLPLSGTVTSVGLFDASGTSSTYSPVRMDTFIVEGVVPEIVTEVIFREDFTEYSDTSLQDFGGWHAYYTSDAASVDESNEDFNEGVIISGSIGATGTNGFLFYDYDGFGGQPVLIICDKQASFGSIDAVTTINFSLYNQSGTANFKVALKVDEVWYVSQDVFNATSWTEQSLDVQTALWNSLTFVAGSSLSEGGAASLPLSGTVTSVGIFDASGTSGYSGRSRIDTYIVRGIAPNDVVVVQAAMSSEAINFVWNNNPGAQYDLESCTDLVTAAWAGYNGYTNIDADVSGTNTLSGIAADGLIRFFRVIEK
jgi:hypothetical protein